MKNYLTLLLFLLLLSCNKHKPANPTNGNNQYYDKAWYFSDHNIPDSSFIYFNKAKDEFLNHNDSVGIAKSLINMAIISGDQNDYFGSQEISLSAIKYLSINNENQREILSSNYNNLGKVAHHLKRYDDADQFYIQSIKLANKEKSRMIYISNLAINLSDQKRYSEALSYFEKIIRNKSLTNDSSSFPRVLTNMSLTKWRQNPNYNPVPSFLKALYIREKKNDLWGQNSSYAHLADYYIQKQSDSALFYANKMYLVAQEIKSADDQLEALQKLIKLSPARETKFFFNVYQNLNDSVQTARSAAKNQFAVIRYNSEKNKANFLKAQAENVEKQKDILVRNIGIGTLILCLLLGYFLYQKRKKGLQQEKEIEVKKTELKYVKKIHDRVANRVYQVMSEVENTPEIDKNDLADKLDVIYKISRDLSYDNKDVHNEESFSIELTKMLYAYASAETNIIIEGRGENLWEAIKDDTKAEVFCILQELMINMKKHSGANTVTLNFKRENDRITVLYVDNGKGMEVLTPKNGLRNTETRIESISGHITFDTKPDGGLLVEFSFPTL
ncbi:ATP-binding protein [Pedobacter kyonggii]|uniref:histidine kinase n=1 Tax=Pedobacter kyonggii TaxID=1926871 RepID=A0A4Q9HEY8_9SPHI|nr:tetratricopeptide repeat-containing sensor histidine kinase [Pedobacter kyonggii]TBO43131.1 tetratricopeptide repeat-containing sensor histidine kinase [Pedobacter kyonggii]